MPEIVNKTTLPMSQVVADHRLQLRVGGLDNGHVFDLREALDAGVKLPPVKIRKVEATFFVTDGFHTHKAHQLAGWKTIDALVRYGTWDDALDDACQANKEHLALKRKPEDLRKQVLMMLANHSEWSARKIAEHVGCSHTFVNRLLNKEEETIDAVEEAVQQIAEQVFAPIAEEQAAEEEEQEEESPIFRTEDNRVIIPKAVNNALADTWHAEAAQTMSRLKNQVLGILTWSVYLDARVLDCLKDAEQYFLTAIPRRMCDVCDGEKFVESKPCGRCKQSGYLAGQQ